MVAVCGDDDSRGTGMIMVMVVMGQWTVNPSH